MSYLYQSPIDMPRGSHYGSDYWISYSYKLNRNVHCYSMLEYANFLNLEMNSEVDFFCEQPIKIESMDIYSKQSSVLDFWVCFKNGTNEFQEVKYSAELTEKTSSALRSQKQIEFQKEWCRANGYKHKVITEKELLCEPFRLQNLQLLQCHLLRQKNIEKFVSDEFDKILISKKHWRIEDIINSKILPLGQEMSFLAYQFYLGNIEINLNDRPLDNSTEVILCETKNTIS